MFSFATVHFAGHEVPGYQPEKALALYKSYLDGSLFFDKIGNINQPADSSSSGSGTSTATPVNGGSSHLVPVIIAVLLVLTSIGGLIVCFLPKPVDPSDDNQEKEKTGTSRH